MVLEIILLITSCSTLTGSGEFVSLSLLLSFFAQYVRADTLTVSSLNWQHFLRRTGFLTPVQLVNRTWTVRLAARFWVSRAVKVVNAHLSPQVLSKRQRIYNTVCKSLP